MKNRKRWQAGSIACFGIVLSAAVLLAAASQAESYLPPSDFPPGAADILGSKWDAVFDAKSEIRPDSGVNQAAFMKDDVSMGTAVDLTALADSDTLVKNAVVAADRDIANVYTALLPDSDGKLLILGGLERVSDKAGYMTLEFNKDPVGLGAGGFGKELPWEMTGSRTEGDIRLLLKFGDGERLVSAEVSRWDGEPDTGSYQKVGSLSEEGCDETGILCAISNDEAIQAGPWLNPDPNGDSSAIPAHRFVEFKINAGALVENPSYASVCALTKADMTFDALKGGN